MLKEDIELSYEDIQLLSNRDALAAFFAKLGYNTNDRLIQNIAAMGFSSDNLKAAITHIERLASQDGRLFEVYLFELKSVTIANTQGIVRAFRNRPGDYLLVLTDDYQRLDFVLVERYTSELSRSQSQETSSINLSVPRQVGVRPHVLTVNRRNPGDVALRVLRRFSYTEADTFAQYEKLLSAYDVADWSEPFFNNRALFSDYYLSTRLPDSPEWKNATDAGAMTRAFRDLRELYADVRETFSNQPEEVVEPGYWNLCWPHWDSLRNLERRAIVARLSRIIDSTRRVLQDTQLTNRWRSAWPTPGDVTSMAKMNCATIRHLTRILVPW